ncbi:MAG: metalloprotease [Gaiellaceae bacterium]
MPITLGPSSAVPTLLFGALFAAYSRHSSAATVGVAAAVGAVGGAISLIVHEVGHVRAARRTPGVRPVGVSLFALGAATRLEGRYRCGRDQLRVALAGPAASLVFAVPILGCVALPVATPLKFAAFLLAGLNVGIAAFSLLPMHPFDGHKCLVGLLWSALDSEPGARKVLRVVGRLALGVDVLGSAYLVAHRPLEGTLLVCVAGAFLLQKQLLRLAHRLRAVPAETS